MTDRPAVSVVVPVFSPGPYLRPLLDCLDRQITPEDGFEALFVDDGSTDTTPDLLKRWSAPRPWAHVIPLARSGWPSRPRNVGLERARGEFVFFVDHDDWLAHDALARMTAFARAHGSDGQWRTIAGSYEVAVGRSAEDFVLKGQAQVAGRLFGR